MSYEALVGDLIHISTQRKENSRGFEFNKGARKKALQIANTAKRRDVVSFKFDAIF